MNGPGKALERILGFWICYDTHRSCIQAEPRGQDVSNQCHRAGDVTDSRNVLWWLVVDLATTIEELTGDDAEYGEGWLSLCEKAGSEIRDIEGRKALPPVNWRARAEAAEAALTAAEAELTHAREAFVVRPDKLNPGHCVWCSRAHGNERGDDGG